MILILFLLETEGKKGRFIDKFSSFLTTNARLTDHFNAMILLLSVVLTLSGRRTAVNVGQSREVFDINAVKRLILHCWCSAVRLKLPPSAARALKYKLLFFLFFRIK